MAEVTDLEGTVLAYIRVHQPCTPYAVRTRFHESPSARFSDSAGSIYPLMRRLEARGLLESRPTQAGKRRGRAYTCTRRGLHAVRRWLRPPEDPRRAVTDDPLRTRMIFLGLLPAARRPAWLDAAERVLLEEAALIDRAVGASDDDLFTALAHDNARRETASRLEWIRAARAVLTEHATNA